MPKHRLRAPGEPLAERPGDDPHIPEMLARTLFRDGTLRRRATRGPRLSIFTEENHARTNHAQTQTQTRTHTVSPEDAPRAPGTASPVSPPTPTPSNLARLPVSIAIEPRDAELRAGARRPLVLSRRAE
ncbi:hypothetical protein EYC84_009116 [Monilinia fructicola]|uniref:Uncharacterized protein n=1 Tax=Monilinia fructicola TaxID=38448 RepID=A0A5M9JAE3_MONFR|nr:hypothetical protein EYC84_009116 [Monilinia fructicola]